MKNVVLLVLLAACLQANHTGTKALGAGDCYSCHQPNYEQTPTIAARDPAVPDHLANQSVYTTQCATCHITSTWDSHPEALFNVNSGPHVAIQCDSCHLDSTNNEGDAHGANTLCTTTCHTATQVIGAGTMTTGHSDIPAFSYTAVPTGFTTANFCLSCHPAGLEKPHNDAIWPQAHGNARNCDSCHDRSKGSDQMGENADCRRCHDATRLMQVTAHPPDVGTTLPSPSGCLARGCHQGGGSGN
jgi:hypothetical protein